MVHLDVSDDLGCRAAAIEDSDPAAHALERVEQAGARGVEPEPVHGELRLGEECGAHGEGRGRGEIAGNVYFPEHDAICASNRDAPGPPYDARTCGLQHQLRVVTRGG